MKRMTIRRRRSSNCYYFQWLAIVATSIPWLTNTSASSYNAYQYDMVTPQFTPDGRLLQVEYAAAAATHSSPIFVIPVIMDDDDNDNDDDDAVENPLTSKPSPQIQNQRTATAITTTNPKNMALILLNLKSSRMTQDRFILLSPPSSLSSSTLRQQTPSQSTNVAATTSTLLDRHVVVVAMSGVVADNIALLRHVHHAMEQDFSTFGSIRQSSRNSRRAFASGGGAVSFILRAVAQQCHLPTLGGGIRPFGSTMLVCGWDDASHAHDKLVVWQCQPSGALQPISLDQIHIVGGGDSADQEVLKRLVQQGIDSEATSDTNSKSDNAGNRLSRVLKGAVRALLEHRRRQQELMQQTPTPPSSSSSSSTEGSSQQADYENDDDDDVLSEEAGLECVILSPHHGIHKLTSHQIASLLSQCGPQPSPSSTP